MWGSPEEGKVFLPGEDRPEPSGEGTDYRELKLSFVIFVCTFDPFGEDRYIYTFENRCAENPGLRLGDGTVKVILNTRGRRDDVTPEMKILLDFIDGGEPGDDFTRELDRAVKAARKNEKCRALNVRWTFVKRGPERRRRRII